MDVGDRLRGQSNLVFLSFWPEQGQALGFVPQVGIGKDIQKGVTTTNASIDNGDGTKTIQGTMLPTYIIAIYKYAIGIVSIVATVVMMIGGIIWMTAGGNGARVGEAKAWIGASLTGLTLAISSYLILSIINPNLVKFKPIKMKTISSVTTGCCSYTSGDKDMVIDCYKNDCDKKGGTFNIGQIAKEGECIKDNGCCAVITSIDTGEVYADCYSDNTQFQCTKRGGVFYPEKNCSEIKDKKCKIK